MKYILIRITRFICLFAILTVSFNLNAQIGNVNDLTGTPIKVKSSERIEGTFYPISSQWSNGEFITTHGTRYVDIPIRFNAFSQSLEILKANTAFTLDSKEVIQFSFSVFDENGNTIDYIFKNGFDTEFPKSQYFRVWFNNGKMKILELIKVTEEKVPAEAYGAPEDTRLNSYNFIYLLKDGEFKKIKMNNRNMSKLFLDRKEDVLNFIKAKSLDVSAYNDFKILSEYVESFQ
ncbi:hypothetical protein [Fulvivirga sp.]|uniref:hypothetical protein n=1 Tax=Fulvivirga sp. TaxID=1931237 RepID=UPI0032F024A9